MCKHHLVLIPLLLGRIVPKSMSPYSSLCLAGLVFSLTCLGQPAPSPHLDIEQIHLASTNAHSLFLDANGRIRAIDTFLSLVKIKGSSGNEQAIAEEVKQLMTRSGAVMVRIDTADQK